MSGPQLRQLGPHSATDSDHDPAPSDGRLSRGPREGFDLIITAVDPRATDWLGHTDWAAELTPRGIVAVVTHSDLHSGRLRDPLPLVHRHVR